MDTLARDLRFALRLIRKAPAVSVATILRREDAASLRYPLRRSYGVHESALQPGCRGRARAGDRSERGHFLGRQRRSAAASSLSGFGTPRAPVPRIPRAAAVRGVDSEVHDVVSRA